MSGSKTPTTDMSEWTRWGQGEPMRPQSYTKIYRWLRNTEGWRNSLPQSRNLPLMIQYQWPALKTYIWITCRLKRLYVEIHECMYTNVCMKQQWNKKEAMNLKETKEWIYTYIFISYIYSFHIYIYTHTYESLEEGKGRRKWCNYIVISRIKDVF